MGVYCECVRAWVFVFVWVGRPEHKIIRIAGPLLLGGCLLVALGGRWVGLEHKILSSSLRGLPVGVDVCVGGGEWVGGEGQLLGASAKRNGLCDAGLGKRHLAFQTSTAQPRREPHCQPTTRPTPRTAARPCRPRQDDAGARVCRALRLPPGGDQRL